ncbi:MAG: EAL domain-containing protein [Methylococcaceae bacterium]|nr:EAL domain-containing protein [Methylococcaceae bacterium]
MRLSVGIKLGFWLALLGTLSTGLTGYYVFDRSRGLLVESSKDKLLTATQVLVHRFTDALAEIAGDVKFLSSLSTAHQIVSGSADSSPASNDKDQLAEIFANLLASHPEYSQIRLIDGSHYGKELVRADRDRGGIKIVTGQQLQEKNHFPYVFETLGLPEGQFYFSEINLNQELGAHLGYGKPTIRIATPVKSREYASVGIVVINVDLDGLFNRIRADLPGDIRALLTNGKGDYLIHPDASKTFGFERGRPFLIQDEIPGVQAILNGGQDHAVLTVSDARPLGASSLAAFVKVPFASRAEPRFVMLGLYSALENVLAESRALGFQVIRLTLSFSLLASIIALILARVLAKPLNLMAKTVGRFTLGQPLSALPAERNDEIGYLAKSFRAMAEQLNDQVAELYASETRLHAILDNAPVGIWLTAIDGRYLFVNKTFCDAVGAPENRFLEASRLADVLGEDIAAACLKSDHDCLASSQASHQSHETLKFVDGKSHILEISRAKLYGIAGEVTGIIGIAMDITERKQAEVRERSHHYVLDLLSKGAPLTEILEALVLGVEAQNPDLLCSISLVDDEGKHLLLGAAPSLPEFYNTAINGSPIQYGAGCCGTSAFTGKRIVAADIANHPNWMPYKELAARAGLASCCSEPIRGSSGKILGTFAVYQHEAVYPIDSEIELVEQAASLAGIAIDRTRANDELQLASLVYQNSSEAMAVTDASGVILNINPAFSKLTGYTLKEVIGKNHNILSSGRQEPAFYQAMWHAINTTGHWKGEIWNCRKDGEIFAESLTINTTFHDDGSVHRRVALFSDITQRKESEQLIWNQANFDPLTGLPNRRMFHDRLEQEIKKAHRTGLTLALIFLDLDRFKEVNDTLGHDMGDRLLNDAANRLSSCVREADTVARLGGDEFTIILGELESLGSLDRIVLNILSKMAEPFQLKNKSAYVSASIGITLYPKDAISPDALIKNADQAMYAAKRQGRNRYCYFVPSMQEAAQARMLIAGDLRLALGAGQFELHYQPILELATGDIHKAEALIRWRHPSRGMVNPSEFIPIAEDIGIIGEIGDWVFREAAGRAAHWRALYDPSFQIGINKSPVQFHDRGENQAAWFDYLRELGLPGQSIVVEITEGLLLDASDTATRQLIAYRDAGIQVALDDFGTGYSSLAYLKKFDIDYLKIDRSFVSNLAPDSNDLALCEAIIVMAHKLGLKVIAEGIETEQQRDLLVARGCDYGQGYWFSKPLSAEAFEYLLINRQAVADK